jgi:flagellar basal-body rod protein FlgB
MFIERLINQGNAPLAEQVLKFTSARHKLLQENIANVSTPNYRNKDLDVAGFQSMLQDRVAERKDAAPGTIAFKDIAGEVTNPNTGLLFHDQNNRSMEQLTVDGMKNALMHNLVVELMRKQFDSLEAALRERLS